MKTRGKRTRRQAKRQKRGTQPALPKAVRKIRTEAKIYLLFSHGGGATTAGSGAGATTGAAGSGAGAARLGGGGKAGSASAMRRVAVKMQRTLP